jgi:hypothetical protein
MNSVTTNQKSQIAIFQPGDRIVAFEPYYYGGKPKKQPETPGIVQSIYAEGQFVAYMRLKHGGNLDLATRSIDDPNLRLADILDLKEFAQQFAKLETKCYPTGAPSYNVPARDTKQNRVRSLRQSLLHAQLLTSRLMGPHAKAYPAQMESGIYRGEIIGESEFHLIQKLNERSAVLHMKHMLTWTAPRGTKALIRYQGHDSARVIEMDPTQSRA